MSDEIIRLNPGFTADALNSGEMQKVTLERSANSEDSELIEYAIKLFGKDFLGVDAIRQMNQMLIHRKPLKVQFELPDENTSPRWLYNKFLIDDLKKQEHLGKARMCVLRPKNAILTTANGTEIVTPIDLNLLYDLFGKNNSNPFGTGRLFDTNTSLMAYPTGQDDFTNEKLSYGYSFVTKEIVPGSIRSTWEHHNRFYFKENGAYTGEFRRTAVETVWDLLVRYAVTGERSLMDSYDWTSTSLDSTNNIHRRMIVSFPENYGITISALEESETSSLVGTCMCI